MIDSQRRFQDYKERISIMQVALELGYRHDPKKGKTTPSFVLHDHHGKECDRIYIKNPNNNANSYWWRRSNAAGQREWGDVIQFVENNIDRFPESAGCRNTVDAVNKVLGRLANMPEDPTLMVQRFLAEKHARQAKPFSIERYERFPGAVDSAMKFLTERAISRETAELFRNNFECIRDKESKYKFKNLAFPYSKPGVCPALDDKAAITGYEVRGFKGFKSKAEGSDSTISSWQAYLGTQKAPLITEIHFAESALDIMAYVQQRRHYLDLESSLFVSVGGTFSNEQVKGLLTAYPHAKPVLHFDNDINGFMYDCRTACLIEGKELRSTVVGGKVNFNVGEKAFSLDLDGISYNKFREASGLRPNMSVEKAPGNFKDWNDVLIEGMKSNVTGQKTIANETVQQKYGTGQAGRLLQPFNDDGTKGVAPEADGPEEPRKGWHR